MKTYIIAIDNGYDDIREIRVKARNKEQAMTKFLWWQLTGVSIKEKKTKRTKA